MITSNLLFLDNILINNIFSILILDIQERIIAIVIIFGIVLLSWFILGIFLLKSEPKVVKVNLADRYKNVSNDELLKYNINYDEFKKIIYQKFIDIHEALTKYDYNNLKNNLTEDLYNYYISEMEKIRSKNYCNVISDFEFLNFKIYNIDNSYDLLKVSIYLNVRMFDYTIHKDTSSCVRGNDKDKVDFEFELTFIKYGNGEKLYDNYIMSRKTCINEMEIVDKDS